MSPADETGLTSMTARPPLPYRDATVDTIEDAYVAFILHCNPAVPPTSRTGPLREALHNLPRSGGKSFDIFTLFILVRELEMKELKTWAELALKLGVEPPDTHKGDSSQKIQQYAVRLKRWMHSMHVDAFFEYLLGIPSPYWTDVPTLATLGERDGVAPADDMAIRALMPNIRPKRSRKRPEDDDLSVSVTSRPRIDSFDSYTERDSPDDHQGRRGASTSSGTIAYSQSGEQATPSLYPYTPISEVSPPSHEGAWVDTGESRKPQQRRHGAKVVSSAWRSRGLGGTSTVKARGRPPLNRSLTDLHGAADLYCDEVPSSPATTATLGTPAASMTTSLTPATDPSVAHDQRASPISHMLEHNNTRPSRPDWSIHLPEPPGNPPGAAKPTSSPPPFPPVTTPQYPHCTPKRPGELFKQKDPPVTTEAPVTEAQVGHTYDLDAAAEDAATAGPGFLDSFTDRTNLDAIIAFQVSTTMAADWYDVDGNQIPSCDFEEAMVICSSMLEHLYNAAPSQSGFLINLAALLGSRMLMTTTKVQMKRLAERNDRSHYACSWEYRLGHIRGTYQMTHSIDNSRLKTRGGEQPPARESGDTDGGEEPADVWKRRYEDILKTVQAKDEALSGLRDRMYETLRR